MKKAGILIIIIGLALAIFTSFTLFTKEKIVDVGAVSIIGRNRDKVKHMYQVPGNQRQKVNHGPKVIGRDKAIIKIIVIDSGILHFYFNNKISN